ncbi:hypothetical protein IGI04_039744 [Brassica rapa subsp. trilocularis]|uniref:RNase H type-1 domain-containing protein n=1 Tax=Brassica rapa subsp. trilocularis TaxID=1813537 RepID=A0ABQ7KQ52_BRACM|nr:hypothetical protein IGI04_039744 [Brassica rapa subsp. trilocularis]
MKHALRTMYRKLVRLSYIAPSSPAPCSVEHVADSKNRVAEEIALSVSRDHRYQSYVALGGPRWLMELLEFEARRAGT